MRQTVGITNKIKRTWLDAASDHLVTQSEESSLRIFLNNQLEQDQAGPEARSKSIGIITKIWYKIPPERLPLRNRALLLLPRITGEERIWLHWGMTALAYPFFRDAVEVVGRLLALQDDFNSTQVKTRMMATWGDRITTNLAAKKLINTLVDWGVLRSTKIRGHYLLARKLTASIPELQLWLLEALLGASAADEIEAQQLLRLPETFPFSISIGVTDLRRYDGFEIHRQGLDMDMVAVRKTNPSYSPKTVTQRTKKNTPKQRLNPPTELRQKEDSTKPQDSPFAAPSIECVKQFRDGQYYGCIALSQNILEAMIRHIWQAKLNKKPNQEGSFMKNIEALNKAKHITDGWKATLSHQWAERNSYYQLRPTTENEQLKLVEAARNRLNMLKEMQKEFFGEQQLGEFMAASNTSKTD